MSKIKDKIKDLLTTHYKWAASWEGSGYHGEFKARNRSELIDILDNELDCAFDVRYMDLYKKKGVIKKRWVKIKNPMAEEGK